MKILHIINKLCVAGAESFVVRLSCAQSVEGHDVVLLELQESNEDGMKSTLKERGVRCVCLSRKRSIYNPLNVFALIPHLKHYDVVHVHLFPAQYWAGFARIMSGSRVPMVTTEHSTSNNRRGNFLLRAVDKVVYRKGFDVVVGCSGIVARSFRECYGMDCEAIENGVDLQKSMSALPIERSGIPVPEDAFVVTMISRIAQPKRHDVLLRAMPYMADKVYLLFVGPVLDDKLLESHLKLMKELGIEGRVRILGSRQDVTRILKASDAAVLASDYEGLSLASLEGLASGKPFLASDVNGLKELVGGFGLLFDNSDPKSFASQVNRLIDDAEFRETVSEACLRRAAMYDFGVMVSKYDELYNRFVVK